MLMAVNMKAPSDENRKLCIRARNMDVWTN